MNQLQHRVQEFIYVLLRVAVYIRRSHLRTRVEVSAFDLLDFFVAYNIEGFLERSRALTALIQLGLSLYEIETVNGKALLQELVFFNTAIRQYSGLEALPEIRNLGKHALNAAIVSKQVDLPRQSGNNDDLDEQNSIASTVRQSAILDKVRMLSTKDSFGNTSGCKMKDLTSAFPQVSERTLRYDLQRLLTQGVIERVGNGGPSLFYVIK